MMAVANAFAREAPTAWAALRATAGVLKHDILKLCVSLSLYLSISLSLYIYIIYIIYISISLYLSLYIGNAHARGTGPYQHCFGSAGRAAPDPPDGDAMAEAHIFNMSIYLSIDRSIDRSIYLSISLSLYIYIYIYTHRYGIIY